MRLIIFLSILFFSCGQNHIDYKIIVDSNDEILTKNFNEYVYKKMQAAKINDELINQYYAANPPYMSVAGLKRYWEKNDK